MMVNLSRKRLVTDTLFLLGLMLASCSSHYQSGGDPKELLDRFFSSAVNEDYAATYACYYAEYQMKVSADEYIKHRKEASVLQAYKIVYLDQDGDTAHAEVRLTFGPSKRLKRKDPVTATVTEDMVKEGGSWKIKVW